jgi:hypothetical protein
MNGDDAFDPVLCCSICGNADPAVSRVAFALQIDKPPVVLCRGCQELVCEVFENPKRFMGK